MYCGVPMIWPATVNGGSDAGPSGRGAASASPLVSPSLPLVSPHQFRDAEVGDFDPALLVEQDVLRLDVAVDHAVVVGVLQGLADLRDDGQGLLRRQLAGIQQPAEAQAVDELHEEVVQTALTPGPSPGGRGEIGAALTLALSRGRGDDG